MHCMFPSIWPCMFETILQRDGSVQMHVIILLLHPDPNLPMRANKRAVSG